jgi:adenosine deaminase
MAALTETAKLAIYLLIISLLFAVGLNVEDEMSYPLLIPKVELHAHLHGSIRQSTLIEFARSTDDSGTSFTCLICPLKNAHLTLYYHHSNYVGTSSFLLEGERDLSKCFGIFQAIYSMIQSKQTVLRVLLEVLEDFMSENVIYLELRSTPRTLEGESFDIIYA